MSVLGRNLTLLKVINGINQRLYNLFINELLCITMHGQFCNHFFLILIKVCLNNTQ